MTPVVRKLMRAALARRTDERIDRLFGRAAFARADMVIALGQAIPDRQVRLNGDREDLMTFGTAYCLVCRLLRQLPPGMTVAEMLALLRAGTEDAR